MEIRKAMIEDFGQLNILYAALDEFHRKAFPAVFQWPEGAARSSKYINWAISDLQNLFLVAEDSGQLLGFVHAYVRQSTDVPILVPRKFGVIEDLIVKEEFRKKGIGRQLMDKAQQWIREQGADLIELNVWDFNTEARKFYESLGYQTASRRMWKWLVKPVL